MSLLLTHARIVSPDLDIEDGCILIRDGRIVNVGANSDAKADVCVDLSGRMVMPGFFDIHSHGADRHDVCDNNLESIRHIARRKLEEGVTTWLPTTLTQPQKALEEIASHCAAYRKNQEFCRTPGLHVEGPFINPKNAGAQNPHHVRPPDFAELQCIHEICPALVLSLAPDLPGADEVIRRATELGITCSAAHTSATARQMLDAKRAGLRHLTHFCNAMTPLHHREIGVVGTGLLDDGLMLEIICDGIHLCPDMLRLLFKLVPIDRLMLITDSMAASWIDSGEVMLGGLEVHVDQGRAVLKDGGALAGSALRFNEGIRTVLETTGIALHELVKATSWNQARSLGLTGFGKIEAGFHADLAILNPDLSVYKTIVDGQFR